MRRVMSILLFLVFPVGTARAEDPVYFADANLKAAVEEALYLSDPTPTDMLSLTSLSVYFGRIENITGLQYALNLQQLAITQCSLSDISPLADLANLKSLVINNNDIHDISALAGLTNLEYLDIHENDDISDISVLSNHLKLRTLILRKNAISNISVLSNLTQLRDVSLMRNDISDISPLSGLVVASEYRSQPQQHQQSAQPFGPGQPQDFGFGQQSDP